MSTWKLAAWDNRNGVSWYGGRAVGVTTTIYVNYYPNCTDLNTDYDEVSRGDVTIATSAAELRIWKVGFNGALTQTTSGPATIQGGNLFVTSWTPASAGSYIASALYHAADDTYDAYFQGYNITDPNEAVTDDRIVAIYAYDRPEVRNVVWQNLGGELWVGQNPE